MMLASIEYNYDVSLRKRQELARAIRINVFAQRMPLAQAVQCGVSAALLAFVLITFTDLLRVYVLEDIIATLGLDWRLTKLLGFSPLMLTDTENLPIIVLYDELKLRAQHLFEFDISRETLEATLGDSGCALFSVNLALWPNKLIEQ
jgi:hypothetical protein